MALFQPTRNGTPPGKRRIPVQLPPRLPDLSRLPVVCPAAPAHFLPVQMRFTGSHFHGNGQRVFVYKCDCCGRLTGYVHHFVTGQPHRLFSRMER